MKKVSASSKTTKSSKDFSLSKLKKEYQLFIDQIFIEDPKDMKYYIQEGPFFYSKTFIVPHSNVPSDLNIQVPLSLTTGNYRKRICLRYTLREVDHKKKQLYFTYSGFYLENVLYTSSTFEFNSDLNLKLKNFVLKSKVLFSKSQPSKCSKRIQKEVIKSLQGLVVENQDNIKEFTLKVLNKTFIRDLSDSVKNNQYVKAIVVTSALA